MNCFICYELLRKIVYFWNALVGVCFVSKQSKACVKEKKPRCQQSNVDIKDILNRKPGREEIIVVQFLPAQSSCLLWNLDNVNLMNGPTQNINSRGRQTNKKESFESVDSTSTQFSPQWETKRTWEISRYEIEKMSWPCRQGLMSIWTP